MSTNTKINNPNEHLEIPKWINVDYFKNILQQDEPSHIAVLNFVPIAAIAPGENFTSVMLRVHMDLEMKDGTMKHKTYILKTMLDDDKGGKFVKKLCLFPKEMNMYHKFIPAFEALYKAAGVSVQLAPKCLLAELNDGRINLVFEDLDNKHFKVTDRLTGYNMEHMTRVLQKLAEFHAASAVYAEQNGPYPNEFSYGFVNNEEGLEFFQTSYDSKANDYKKAMAKWGLEQGEEYVRKFPTFEQYWACGTRTLNTEENTFNVLTHGDFWSSNVMQNYLPNGAIDEVLFVDFQLCKWGSPAEDLLFIITLSANKDIRIKDFDQFVQIYYERLVECLKVLKYTKPLPKLRDLQMAMYQENTTFYAFFAVFNHLPTILLPSDKDSNIHSLMRKDEIGEQFRTRTYGNPAFVNVVRDIYQFYTQRGIFNFEDYN